MQIDMHHFSLVSACRFLRQNETLASLYVCHLRRTARGAKDKLHDPRSIAIATEAHSDSSRAVAAGFPSFITAIRAFFRPGVLPFLALALTVGGWSYGYKLSLYLHHPTVGKASATRMWVDHRDDNSLLADSHQSSLPDKFSSPLALVVAPPRLPQYSRDMDLALPVPSRTSLYYSTRTPLRAPPSL
jgi:hypothetical protein